MKRTEMRLLPEFFSLIERGEKTVEARLYDEKRRPIAVGDELVFRCGEKSLTAVAVALHRADSFEELFAREDLLRAAGRYTERAEAVAVMRKFYSEEEERKYGVVGIELKVRKENEV